MAIINTKAPLVGLDDKEFHILEEENVNLPLFHLGGTRILCISYSVCLVAFWLCCTMLRIFFKAGMGKKHKSLRRLPLFSVLIGLEIAQ